MTWLEGIPHIVCPQHSSRRGWDVDLVVLHYSAGGGTAESTLRYFASRPQREASYHLVIDREGRVAQGVPLDRASWHGRGIAPGDTRYKPGRANRRSAGICLVNRGWDVDAAVHDTILGAHEKSGRLRHWEAYPEVQIQAFRATLFRVLELCPGITRVCGHEDVAAGKSDPGPVFPWLDALGGSGLIRTWNTWPDRETGGWRSYMMRG